MEKIGQGHSKATAFNLQRSRSRYNDVYKGTPIFHFNGIRFTREDISVLHEAKTISLTLF